MQAMLLGAGEGPRLRPITATRPKAMIPVANRPIMEHMLLLLKRHGIKDVYSNLYYLADQVESYFGDGSALDMSIRFRVEQDYLGTAGGAKNLEQYFHDTFIAVSDNMLTDFDLSGALEFHRKQGSMATLLLVPAVGIHERNSVITDRDGRIKGFSGKPGGSGAFSGAINTGIYILDPAVLSLIPPGVHFDFFKDLFPLLLEEGQPIFGLAADGYFNDMSSIDSYIKAQVDALSGAVKLSIPGEQVMPGVWVGRSAKISTKADLKGPMVLGENCDIASGVHIKEFSVIGDGVVMAPSSFAVRSTVYRNSYIGEGSVVSGSIICKNVVIKDGVRVGEGAVVSDFSILNRSAAVKPGIRVWPEKTIDEGVVLSSSEAWEQRRRHELFNSGAISGLVNFEFTPEFAVRLGNSIGATMKKGASVIVSRDPSATARMMKRALVAGLSSSGVTVCDLQGQPLPVLWHMIDRNNYTYGIHTSISQSSAETVDIQVLDKDGLALSPNDECRIEALLAREDPKRTSAAEVGGINHYPRAVDIYTEDSLLKMNIDATRENPMKVVVDCGYGFGGGLLPSLLVKMGVEVTSLNAIEQPGKMPKSSKELARAKSDLALIVNTIEADLGVLMDPQGARMFVADNSGRVLTDLELSYLYALLQVRSRGRGARSVTVPSFTPGVFIRSLTANGATVYRARANTRALADLARTSKSVIASDLQGGFIFPELHNGFDAIYGTAKFVELVASDSTPLSQLVQLVPEHHLLTEVVSCPWELKEQVMRDLLARMDDPSVDTFDGYRKNEGEDWYMVLPDPKRPEFTVYAEGSTEAKAADMIRRAMDEILPRARG